MSNYTLTQQEFRRLKQRLTYRTNRLKKAEEEYRGKEHDRALRANVNAAAKQVIAEVSYAQSIFDEKGYPDAHHNWERAKDDAICTQQRTAPVK